MERADENINQPGLRWGDSQFREIWAECPSALLVYAEGKVMFANAAMCALLGVSDVQQILGRSPFEFVHAKSRAAVEEQLARVSGYDQQPNITRERWLRLDGTSIDVEAAAAPLGSLGTRAGQIHLRALSDGREPENIMRKAHRQIRDITENVEDFAVFSLDASGRVETWNRGAERLFRYLERDIIGQHFEILFTPEDQAEGAPRWEMRQAATTGIAQDERWHLRADGTRFFVSGHLVSLRNDTGQVVGYTKVAQDQTARHRAQEALRESEARYRQLAAELERRVNERTEHLEQSVRTWESFCYSIAHDLRAPLRTISGFAGALVDDYAESLDATAREYAHRMMAAAHRLDDFIQDLLDFGRLAHVELPQTAMDLDWAIDRVLAELAEEIATAGAVVNVKRPLSRIMANTAALNQVLSNLVSNAIKFVPPGVAPQVEIRSEHCERFIRLSISDNGIGISPEHQERIFQLFERLHPQSAFPGTGVGLAIVRKAMERMGGQVGLSSAPGQGSSFWIELPRPA